MKLIKKIGLLALLSVFCSLSIPVPAMAEQPMAPIVLDAYSMAKDQGREIYVSGLVADGLDVLIYIEGQYQGVANISYKEGEINPFSFSAQLEINIKSYNISIISKDRVSSILSSPVHARDRKVKAPIASKPNLFAGGLSEEAVLSSETEREATSSNVLSNISDNITPPPSPTIIGPNLESVIGTPKPLILGLTKSKTLVHIYIDGVYNGKTPILEDKSGTANFAYRPCVVA